MAIEIEPGTRVRTAQPVTVTHFGDAPDVTFSPGEVLRVRECYLNDGCGGDGCVVVAKADGLARRVPARLLVVPPG